MKTLIAILLTAFTLQACVMWEGAKEVGRDVKHDAQRLVR